MQRLTVLLVRFPFSTAELQRIAQEGFSSDHTVTPVPLPPLPRHAFVRPPCSYAAGRKRFAKRVTELSQKRMEAQAKATAALASKTTSGIPLTNSLSCADMPRLTQCVASVLEGTGEWKPSRHSAAGGGAGSGAGAGSGSGGGGGGDSDASSVPHMSVIGAEERPSRWLHRAGVDLSSISTKLALQSLRSAEGKRGMPPAAAPSPTRSGTDGEAAGPSGPVWRLQNPEVSEGVVMIAKVFLGNCQLLDSTDGTPIDPATGKPQPPAGSAASVAATGATDNPDHKLRHSVCRARSDDPKQRTWVILEPSLVLPEYIIEFEYDWQKESADGSGTHTHREREGCPHTCSHKNRASSPLCSLPLLCFALLHYSCPGCHHEQRTVSSGRAERWPQGRRQRRLQECQH